MYQIAYDPLKDGISNVELIDKLGSDLSVVNAARVSYGKRSEQLTDKDAKLINYLMRNKHGTPFEHVVFQFRVRAPLFVVHQWERHRMSSFNEESGRYVELRPDFYIKNDTWAEQRKVHAKTSFKIYQNLIKQECSKEDARSVLPSNLYKEFWWTVNARSLMNFLALRNDEHAQEEIREYAKSLELIFGEVIPNIWTAFVNNGRVAP